VLRSLFKSGEPCSNWNPYVSRFDIPSPVPPFDAPEFSCLSAALVCSCPPLEVVPIDFFSRTVLSPFPPYPPLPLRLNQQSFCVPPCAIDRDFCPLSIFLGVSLHLLSPECQGLVPASFMHFSFYVIRLSPLLSSLKFFFYSPRLAVTHFFQVMFLRCNSQYFFLPNSSSLLFFFFFYSKKFPCVVAVQKIFSFGPLSPVLENLPDLCY